MTKEEREEKETLTREIDRFSNLLFKIHKLHNECETEQGLLISLKLMDYVSREIGAIAKEIGKYRRDDI